MNLTATCLKATPHDFDATVHVIGAEPQREAFCALELTIGDDRLTVHLPAHAYNRARDIADLWPRLVDRTSVSARLSPAALARIQNAPIGGVSCICSDCDGADTNCRECNGTGRVVVKPLEAVDG